MWNGRNGGYAGCDAALFWRAAFVTSLFNATMGLSNLHIPR